MSLFSQLAGGDDEEEQKQAMKQRQLEERRRRQAQMLDAARQERGTKMMDTGSAVAGGTSMPPRNEALSRLFGV